MGGTYDKNNLIVLFSYQIGHHKVYTNKISDIIKEKLLALLSVNVRKNYGQQREEPGELWGGGGEGGGEG